MSSVEKEQLCEACNQHPGSPYTLYLGVSVPITNHTYKLHRLDGQRDVYLCEACKKRIYRKYVQRQLLIIGFVTPILIIIAWLLLGVINVSTNFLSIIFLSDLLNIARYILGFAILFFIVIGLPVYLNDLFRNENPGELAAQDLKREEITQEGIDTTFTTHQLKAKKYFVMTRFTAPQLPENCVKCGAHTSLVSEAFKKRFKDVKVYLGTVSTNKEDIHSSPFAKGLKTGEKITTTYRGRDEDFELTFHLCQKCATEKSISQKVKFNTFKSSLDDDAQGVRLDNTYIVTDELEYRFPNSDYARAFVSQNEDIVLYPPPNSDPAEVKAYLI